MRLIQNIKTALPYLHVPAVRKELDAYLDELDKNAEDAGFIPDDAMERMMKDLEAAMNDHDEETGERRARLKKAAALAEESAEANDD